jgi:hypothetical protein
MLIICVISSFSGKVIALRFKYFPGHYIPKLLSSVIVPSSVQYSNYYIL